MANFKNLFTPQTCVHVMRTVLLVLVLICRSNPVVWQEARPEVEASDGKSKKKK